MDTNKVIKEQIEAYKQDQRTLAKGLKLITKINNASVKVQFERTFAREFMNLGEEIQQMERYIKSIQKTGEED